VVSLTHFLQGPSGVQVLADLGADVVKVEPPGRGAWERSWTGAQYFKNGTSVFFLLANRNQRSIGLDLKVADGKEILWRLIERSDVLVENFRPGALDRLGFDYETVARRNPRLVYCSCSGYGPTGPYRDQPGQDLLAQALSGLAAQTGRGGATPNPVGAAVVDQHSAMLIVIGVLAALRRRDRTGSGCRVDVNLLSSALDLLIEPLAYYLNGAPLQGRSHAWVSDPYHEAPYGIYPTQDGAMAISMSDLTPLAEATSASQLAEFQESEVYERRDEISEILGRATRTRTTREWVDTFRTHGIWCAPVQDLPDVVNDPQVLWNDSFMTFDYPEAGKIRVLKHPIRYDGQAPPLRRRPPQLGEHTEEVLCELGYTPQRVDDLRGRGVI